MKINIQASLIGVGLFLFYLAAFADLTVDYRGFFSVIKYVAILWIASALLLAPAKKSTNIIAFIGISFFCIMTMIYTLSNLEEASDVVVALGYWVCASIYYFSSRNSAKITSITKASLIIAGIVFIVANSLYINDSSSYTISKNQFFGFFNNPNTLAGLAGVFFIIYFAEFIHADRKMAKFVFAIALAMCGFFLLISGSRAAVLAVFIVVFYLFYKTRGLSKILLLFFALALISVFAYIAINTDFSGSNRDFFEETGRVELYGQYLESFSDTYLIIGTGVSQEAGRLKSELSYLDILLFSGIGSLGFIVFLAISLKQAMQVKMKSILWASALFIYIAVISIFEGYAANIGSLPSLLFYLLPGIIGFNSRTNLPTSSNSSVFKS